MILQQYDIPIAKVEESGGYTIKIRMHKNDHVMGIFYDYGHLVIPVLHVDTNPEGIMDYEFLVLRAGKEMKTPTVLQPKGIAVRHSEVLPVENEGQGMTLEGIHKPITYILLQLN